jgi:hypothetical protein
MLQCGMAATDYKAPATVFVAANPLAGRERMIVRDFNTTAEAIRFVMEEVRPDLDDARIDSSSQRLTGEQIRKAYESPDFPRGASGRVTRLPRA